MTPQRSLRIGLLFVGLAGTAGCGVQDSTQPPLGSISAGARKDDPITSHPPGKTNSGPIDHK
jgi:hypothetical protein